MFITQLYGELLVIFLIILTSSRIFFIDHSRIDSFALFAPLTFLTSILYLLNWGISFTGQILFCLSFIVLFINWRGLLRFFNHLYIDTYSLGFKISTGVLLAFTVSFAIFLIINRPLHLDEKKYQILTETKTYTKSQSGEYVLHSNPLDSKDLILKIYSPDPNQGKQENNLVALFIPDKRASIHAYDSYLTLLAKSGFKVYSANFGFSKLPIDENIKFKYPHAIQQAKLEYLLKKSNSAQKAINFFKPIHAKEFEILSQIANKNEPPIKKFVIVADGIPAESLSLISNPARKIESCFKLNSIPEYKTNGYGFVEQTDPVTAITKFGLKKDISNHSASYAAMKTKNEFEALK